MQRQTVDHALPPDDVLDRAARLIETNGRHIGDFWPRPFRGAWTPGTPCCVAGAIGVAIGAVKAHDVTDAVVPCVIVDDQPPHPAMAALMAHLGFDTVNEVFAWSDEHDAAEIAAEMRACAATLRTAVSA